MSQKILFLDIETAPNVGYTWGKWEQDVISFIDSWYILSIAYKWLGEKKTRVAALCDMPGYKPGMKDAKLLPIIWKLLDEADIVVAQNGDRFDLPKINTRFLMNKMPPPSPYKTIDTFKVVKGRFAFNSNKLDDLAKDLGVGQKVKHTGFDLWRGCMSGDRKAWNLMKRYNANDVDILESIYLKMRPYHSKHPVVTTGLSMCIKCGSSNIVKRGFTYGKTTMTGRFRCNDCGGWMSDLNRLKVGEFVNA